VKILEPSRPIKREWWIGQKINCSSCGFVGELEEKDAMVETFLMFPKMVCWECECGCLIKLTAHIHSGPLKRCPCCQGKADSYKDEEGEWDCAGWTVSCSACELKVTIDSERPGNPRGWTPAEMQHMAEEQWNRRP
jgi:hypothetical protein